MKEQVMIYSIAESATSNAEKLFFEDKFFYWNSEKFEKLSIGDIVFIVNKTQQYVLFTLLDKINIATQIDEINLQTSFNDNNKKFTVNGIEANGKKWNHFVRFEIIKNLNTDKDWKFTPLGAGSSTFLNRSVYKKVEKQAAKNRISNIEELSQLTTDETILQVLENCKLNFITNSNESMTPVVIKKHLENNHLQLELESSKNATTYLNPSEIPKELLPILTAIKTKPFILLAGISGTGKSRLVRTLAFKTCFKKELQSDPKKPGNFELIPVRPNWHDSTELMGYVSRIKEEKYVHTPFLSFVAKAWNNLDVPFFLCLDEMNLAPVEQYFAEYLSIIETRQNKNGALVTDPILKKSDFENLELYEVLLKKLDLSPETFANEIALPPNLVVVGTVNMDETTHSFSRKVLDRAMTFEMNEVDLDAGLELTKKDWDYPDAFIPLEEVIGTYTSGAEVFNNAFAEREDVLKFLKTINEKLEGTPFKIAYRVRDEFLIYCYYASQYKSTDNDNVWFNSALDEMTMMKILSRIEGDSSKTEHVINDLEKILVSSIYPKSNKKLLEMKDKLQFGYTSFWS